jgi:hydroxylamine reductase
MHMFCYQCQETGEGKGCRHAGVCGKDDEVANNQDLLIWTLKGLSVLQEELTRHGVATEMATAHFLAMALFSTVTNVNFDAARVMELVHRGQGLKERLLETHEAILEGFDHPMVRWKPANESALKQQAYEVGVLFSSPDEDTRSLRETAIYGLKGIAAYQYHAMVLGHDDPALTAFMVKALAATTRELEIPELLELVLETGRMTILSMALIDRANTATYGEPEITRIPLGVRNNPGILVTGHDLKDMAQILEQTEGQGVDVYTHSQMLATHYYPAFKKFKHLAGNYGNAWWNQDQDFVSFNGPIIVTSNCITPVQDAYRDRIFSTGPVAYPGIRHVDEDPATGRKDWSRVIALAKVCPAPRAIDGGEFVGGFGRAQLDAAAGRIAQLVREGKITRFIVIGGCDGRDMSRDYYRQVAELLPKDAIILTAGCAKYRFLQSRLGDIEGVPRVIDAGQCNDCYALVTIALKLQEVFGVEHLNALPISFDIPWYDQKSVAVLLALFYLGVKGIRLGPTHPAFLSPAVKAVLEDKFDLKRIGNAREDVAAMMAGH